MIIETVNIYSGCAGWSYNDWKGSFYPHTAKNEDFLKIYSKIFNFTEVNTSYYNVPNMATIERWREMTPPSFKFSVKVWKQIINDIHTANIESTIEMFFSRFSRLQTKIIGFLLQFPPNFLYSKSNQEALINLLNILPAQNQYFLELRHESWFQSPILTSFMAINNISLVTSYIDAITPYYFPKQRKYYIRMIKDRALTSFSHIQRLEPQIFDHLIQNVERLRNEPSITDILVIFNNHFRGFSPEDVITFRKRASLPFKSFSPQRRLDSFLK